MWSSDARPPVRKIANHFRNRVQVYNICGSEYIGCRKAPRGGQVMKNSRVERYKQNSMQMQGNQIKLKEFL